MGYYIKLQNISKIYGRLIGGPKVVALNNVSLRVSCGESVGIVGPNGAGKTTLLRIMAGVLSPTAGTVQRKVVKIGYVPDPPPFYETLTAKENLLYFARIDNLPNPESAVRLAMEKVDLNKWCDLTPAEFSNGMRRRLGIARALLRNTRMLIMDEPFAGLDPDGAIKIKEILKVLKKNDVSFVLSSHNLTYVDELSDRILFIRDGKIIKSLDKQKVNIGDLIIHCEYRMSNLHLRIPAKIIDGGLMFKEVSKSEVPVIIEMLVRSDVKIYEVIFNDDNLEREYSKIIREVL